MTMPTSMNATALPAMGAQRRTTRRRRPSVSLRDVPSPANEVAAAMSSQSAGFAVQPSVSRVLVSAVIAVAARMLITSTR
ncbi:hypothetical protein HNR16_001694 [Pseudoclavibacter chungangensis]|nr:hypothetical protein [Pseudoclavibacter chungangensis]NYJ66906.1 hypothetical protein [Pseudoclavibacter chungangensis]